VQGARAMARQELATNSESDNLQEPFVLNRYTLVRPQLQTRLIY